MLDEKTWNEFRNTGLFWWMNSLLHTFGWCIVVEVDDDDKVIRTYPARTKFRGFDASSNDDGYRKITQYMVDNASELIKECE